MVPMGVMRGTRLGLLLAGCLGGPAVANVDPIQAMLTVDPPTAIVGQTVSVYMTISNTGSTPFNNVSVFLSMPSGGGSAQLVTGLNPSPSNFIGAGQTMTFGWTLLVTGLGEVQLQGDATGTVNFAGDTVTSSVILLIPGPAAPALRILNNHLRPGRSAQLVVHGTASGKAALTVFDQTGAPLGPAGLGAVALDTAGNGSTGFNGVVSGRRLSTGVYWIVATGDASGKAPLLVTGP